MDSRLESTKRKRTKTDEEYSDKHSEHKPLCKYGENCYQKNSHHLQKFRHPQRDPVPVLKPEQELQEKSNESITCLMSSGSTEVKEQETSEANGTSSSVTAEHGIGNQESKEDDSELAHSPLNVKENIKQKFLVEMPDDFYQFWAFCQSICQQNTLELFKASLGLQLVGPFELLDQTQKKSKPKDKSDNLLTKWRFYYDPPEFQTVMVGDLSKGYHIGYFRDAPNEMPAFVGSNTESEGCVLTPLSDNLFSAVSQLLSVIVKKVDPFKKSQLTSLKKQLEDWANKNGIPIEPQNQILKKRKKLMVAKTFYECGIVVPVDKKTKVGYREIPETSANIKKICKKIVESQNLSEQNKNSDSLQELVTYVQYANDESDYGMGLELGLDLLAFGGEVFHPTILHLLGVAYELLERKEFFVILKAHLSNRRRLATAKTGN
uniref:EOG090X0BAY n=1 Tax=Daphnia similis TaxID=35528 RepID=A0A4Y7N5D2_9CRUS|nr:EOG090X0BAY [Daphnia similis]